MSTTKFAVELKLSISFWSTRLRTHMFHPNTSTYTYTLVAIQPVQQQPQQHHQQQQQQQQFPPLQLASE
jgi:hypothetical protein